MDIKQAAENPLGRVLERVAIGLLVAGMIWMIKTVNETNTSVAIIETKLLIMADDRYTGSEASRDQKLILQWKEEISRRVGRLEGILEKLRDSNN